MCYLRTAVCVQCCKRSHSKALLHISDGDATGCCFQAYKHIQCVVQQHTLPCLIFRKASAHLRRRTSALKPHDALLGVPLY